MTAANEPHVALTQDELEEEWNTDFMDLETVLSIHQLFLLLSIAAGEVGCGIQEPIWPLIPEGSPPSIFAAPLLTESALMEMSQARALERLDLLTLSPHGACWARWELTAKGEAAVRFWRDQLEEWLSARKASAT